MEENYKAKYEKLIAWIKDFESISRYNLNESPEPEQPDSIDDRKKVAWYRNDVFDHGFALGMLGACQQILAEATES